ncbi:hypothetical protein BC827DRAFT_971584 [Russula dissimulans]|nr:hypothetical protein BC827DRAFT_971584 [Russula dissimulans]
MQQRAAEKRLISREAMLKWGLAEAGIAYNFEKVGYGKHLKAHHESHDREYTRLSLITYRFKASFSSLRRVKLGLVRVVIVGCLIETPRRVIRGVILVEFLQMRGVYSKIL